jgi:hypothetical protein
MQPLLDVHIHLRVERIKEIEGFGTKPCPFFGMPEKSPRPTPFLVSSNPASRASRICIAHECICPHQRLRVPFSSTPIISGDIGRRDGR